MKASAQVLLFDLDGTLIDSAPDLAGAANDLRAVHGLPPLPHEALRPMVGTGARGMVGVAFGVFPEEPRFAELRDAFLARYAERLLEQTQVFAAMVPVLDALDAAGLRWGIVTNKAMRFTAPLVDGLGLSSRAAVVIAGDSTPHAKPHPASLLEAARRMDVASATCVYIGDDHRDLATASYIRTTHRFQNVAPLLGIPALAMPMGSDGAWPTGVQIMAARYREDLILDAAEVVEAALGIPQPIDTNW